jgi:hypothetical protein
LRRLGQTDNRRVFFVVEHRPKYLGVLGNKFLHLRMFLVMLP